MSEDQFNNNENQNENIPEENTPEITPETEDPQTAYTQPQNEIPHHEQKSEQPPYINPNYDGHTNYDPQNERPADNNTGRYYQPVQNAFSFGNENEPKMQNNNQNGQSNMFPPTEPSTLKPPKKDKTGITIVFCIVLSLVCGFIGSFGAFYFYKVMTGRDLFTDPKDEKVTIITEKQKENEGENAEENITAVASVVKTALPSVVEITTEAVVTSNFYGQYVSSGAGSGVVITDSGYIVTNNHVVAGANKIRVRLYDGKEYDATLKGTDSQNDIAVVKINAENLVPATFGSSGNLTVGELAVAIGNPLGQLGGTVTDGIISALDREITIEGEKMTLLQTNASINPGNSGGGLFDSNGCLIGIVNSKKVGEDVEGLGFAIPVDTAKPIIEEIIKNGRVTGRPSLGISYIEITTEMEKYYYGVNQYGVYVTGSTNADFKSADLIMAIDGNSVSSAADIKSILAGHKVGDSVTVTVARRNKLVDVQVTLIELQQTAN